MPIRLDERTTELAFGALSALAAAHGVTVYDACYLELALRLGLPLASPHGQLRQAAAATGVPLILGA